MEWGVNMPEEEQCKKRRQAVIVGINEYIDSSNIPKLAGAVNDAKEMHQKLIDLGKFEVANNHFLLDRQATCKAIRQAISDLLWKTDPCDLALFYFAGHGFVDGYSNMYIATYDMLKYEPLVYGINIQELKQIFLDSVNKSTVLMIFDCCHSGISTKGDRGISDVKIPYDLLFGNLKEERGKEGKIIMASSAADEASRENLDCMHVNEDSPHPHGIFSFNLIEGLDGKASDETGIVTYGGLRKYVWVQINSKGGQIPKFFEAQGSTLDIRITVASQKHDEYILGKIQRVEDYILKDDPLLRILAVAEIHTVLNYSSKHSKALELKSDLCKTLDVYKKAAFECLREKEITFVCSIPDIFPKFEKLALDLHFDKILTLDKNDITMLGDLCRASLGKTTIELLIEKYKYYNPPPSTLKPIEPTIGVS